MPRFFLLDGYAAAFAVSVISPFFNTEAVQEVASWNDLWDPRFASRFMAITPKQTQYLIDAGWAKLAALKPNVQTVYDNNVSAVLQVAQGQADIGAELVAHQQNRTGEPLPPGFEPGRAVVAHWAAAGNHLLAGSD